MLHALLSEKSSAGISKGKMPARTGMNEEQHRSRQREDAISTTAALAGENEGQREERLVKDAVSTVPARAAEAPKTALVERAPKR